MLVKELTEQLAQSKFSSEPSENTDTDGRDIGHLEELCQIPAYPYRELDKTEIRLVQIVPGKGIIKCLLRQMPISKVKHFYALSYVWGDATEKRTILVEGRSYHITKNLWEALHQIRQRPYDIGYPEDYFWIDAICINQKDIEERSSQVGQMMEIYHTGHVIIWLGPCKDKARVKAIELLFEKVTSMWSECDPEDDDGNLDLRKEFGGSYNDMVRATVYILQRPWFERVWTIQEACLDADGATLYVGRHSVHLTDFISFFDILSTEHPFLYFVPGSFRVQSFNKITDLYRAVLYNWDNNPSALEIAEVLAMLFGATPMKVATDPRDQLYGLLGLLRWFKDENLPGELIPNYRLHYEEVYWNYAVFIFQSLGDLRLLGCSRREFSHLPLPSWVPDFRHLILGPKLIRESSVRLSCDKRTLHLQGSILGTFRDFITRREVKDLLPRIEEIPTALPERLREFEKHILEPSASIMGTTIEEAFNNILGKATKLIPEKGGESFYQVYRRLSKARGGKRSRYAKKKFTTDTRAKEEGIAGKMSMPYLLLGDGTILRVTRADADIRPGDLVCVFKGAQGLSLVRTVGEDYIFLGRCDVENGPLKGQDFGEDYWINRDIYEFNVV